MPRLPDLLVVRYEDLRARPEQTLAGLLAFMGTPGDARRDRRGGRLRLVREHAEDGAEADLLAVRRPHGARKDRSNPQSFKVRRGKVGGWRDHFSEAEVGADRGADRARARAGVRLRRRRRSGARGQRLRSRGRRLEAAARARSLRTHDALCYAAATSSCLKTMDPAREANRVRPHQPPADGRRAGLAALDPAQQRARRRSSTCAIIDTKDHPFLAAREGQLYLRGGQQAAVADGRPAVVHAACASCRPS